MTLIFHITTKQDWETAVSANHYHTHSLDSEGFIHCSTREQVIGTANAYFHGQTDLLLLCLDPARITADIVYEDLYGKGQQFPHIYGSLSLDAVVHVIPFPPAADGSFTLPEGI
ncbi:MAG: DUF952 domain-containing protein [Anaerolineales bacterium]|nr:DUF952 domain-containing protein [Anaerolineales bacterium]